ncbi:GntR family transcriptional regulator [Roseibium salinum]|uniref:GntR family transcriptional regulator n=1 Tax=Roseibium salinum TaxID=1604349 RepID=UPI0036117F16
MRDAIISGELPLGSKLSEQRLADALGVSRSPVRDALAALQSEGLVTISPKRGTFVFTPDLRIVDELCEHRAIIETAALRLGIERNHDGLMLGLERSCAAMQRAVDANDTLGYTLGDYHFHNAIVESPGNRSIVRTYDSMMSPLKALRTHLFIFMKEKAARSMSEHISIIEACRVKDTGLAVSCLGEHIGHLADAYRAKISCEEPGKEMRAVEHM